MKPERLKVIGCIALTLAAAVSALLWIAVAFITARSFWFTDSLCLDTSDEELGYGYYLEAHRGKFYVHSWIDEQINPFEPDMDWRWETSKFEDPSNFTRRMERGVMENSTVRRRRLLGVAWGQGDPSTKLSHGAWPKWAVYIPAWYVLVVLAILPGVWLWRRRRWSRDRRRMARRSLLLTGLILIGIPVLLLALVFVNARFLGPGEKPLSGRTSHPAAQPAQDPNGTILRVMTYNIWMGQAYKGAWRFEKPELVAERIRDIGQFIKKYDPHLAFLQEVVMESGPGSVDQTPILAEAAGMHAWAFGEAFNQGLPFYRMIEGNAILSRWPLEVVANQPMAGYSPSYRIGVSNQRTLWCKTLIAGKEVLLASVHLTSDKARFRPVQMQQILDFVGDGPAVLAGDINATPTSSVIKQAVDSGRFSAQLDGPHTCKSYRPTYKIDYIFAPAEWKLVEHKVIQTDLSDHLPVLSTYRIPLATNPD